MLFCNHKVVQSSKRNTHHRPVTFVLVIEKHIKMTILGSFLLSIQMVKSILIFYLFIDSEPGTWKNWLKWWLASEYVLVFITLYIVVWILNNANWFRIRSMFWIRNNKKKSDKLEDLKGNINKNNVFTRRVSHMIVNGILLMRLNGLG